MDSKVVQENMGYSRLVSWEVYNFMAYAHAKCEFDERGIVTIKGYNDSGKSAMLQALNVLMFNIKANQQIGFIKDDCDYFRVVAYFDDGIVIVRDKYINGQSLYEMYRGTELIFSTKQGKTLTRVTGVPEPIEKYLGLIHHEGTCLNSRSCIEKQLLVQTTGSENYKLLNVILKSEELAIATQMLNEDKNKLVQDINSTESKLHSAKEILGVGISLTDDLVSSLERLDENCNGFDSMLGILSTARGLSENMSSITVPPHMDTLDITQLNDISGIQGLVSELGGIPDLPNLSQIDVSGLDMLCDIESTLKELSGISDLPELSVISTSDLDLLCSIQSLLSELDTVPDMPILNPVESDRLDSLSMISQLSEELVLVDEEIAGVSNRLNELDTEIQGYAHQLEVSGGRLIRCPNCGTVYDEEQGHNHE